MEVHWIALSYMLIGSQIGLSANLILWISLGGPMVKNPPANAEDMGSILGLGRLHTLWGN